VQEAEKRAQAWVEHQIPEGMRALAVDEQYGSKRGEAYLNIVDVHSGLVLASIPPVTVDGESWELLFLQMEEQGLKWHTVASDGGRAIQDAVENFNPIQDEAQEITPKRDALLDSSLIGLCKEVPGIIGCVPCKLSRFSTKYVLGCSCNSCIGYTVPRSSSSVKYYPIL
jgi:hypothetical protein